MISWYKIVGCYIAIAIVPFIYDHDNRSSPFIPVTAFRFPKPPKAQSYFNDPVVTTDTPSCVIPFSRAGNLIVIRAKVGDTEGNFILDTGAPKLILNITYFRNLQDAAPAEGESGGITGETSPNSPAILQNFSFGPIKYHNVEADRINLGHLENSRGIKIHGLLGMQLFKRFEMIIDYDKSLIYLHLVSKKEMSTYKSEMLSDTSAYDEFSIKIDDNKLLIYGEMSGKRLVFLIDTGAESNVLDSRLPDKIFENVNITNRIVLAGSGSQKVEALGGNMRNMKLGKVEIGILPVLVTNLVQMCYAYEKCIDGMLGFDFLSRQKIGFNFVRRKMYIWR